MDNPKTMRVKPWGKNQGDHVIINVDDFNPEKHTPIDGESRVVVRTKLTGPDAGKSDWTPEAFDEMQRQFDAERAKTEDTARKPVRKKTKRKTKR